MDNRRLSENSDDSKRDNVETFIDKCTEFYEKLSIKPHHADPLFQFFFISLRIKEKEKKSEDPDDEKDALKKIEGEIELLKNNKKRYIECLKKQYKLTEEEIDSLDKCIKEIGEKTNILNIFIKISSRLQTLTQYFSELPKFNQEDKTTNREEKKEMGEDSIVSQRTTQRTYEDFLTDSDLKKGLNGKSASEGRLSIKRKKPLENKDASQNSKKYSALHYFKRRDPKTEPHSIDEVRLAELLRFLVPKQPKARMRFDQFDTYVDSKEIPNSTRIFDDEDNENQILDPFYYGTTPYKLEILFSSTELDEEKLEQETCYIYLKDDDLEYAVKINNQVQRLPVPYSFPNQTRENDYARKKLKNQLSEKKNNNISDKYKNEILYLCGYRGGAKKLGELNFDVAYLLEDTDYNYRNILIDELLNFYSIDRGRSLGGRVDSPFYTGPVQGYSSVPRHQILLNNNVYHHEVLRAILKFIVLPDAYFQIFFYCYPNESKTKESPDRTPEKLAVFFIKNRNGLRNKIFSDDKEFLIRWLSPDFLVYCETEQAKNDLNEFKNYIRTFSTTKKNLFIQKYPGLLDDIDASFKKISDLIVLKKEKGADAVKEFLQKEATSLVVMKQETLKIKNDETQQQSLPLTSNLLITNGALKQNNKKSFYRKAIIAILLLILCLLIGLGLAYGGIGGIALAAAIKPLAVAAGISLPGAGLLTGLGAFMVSLGLWLAGTRIYKAISDYFKKQPSIKQEDQGNVSSLTTTKLIPTFQGHNPPTQTLEQSPKFQGSEFFKKKKMKPTQLEKLTEWFFCCMPGKKSRG